MVSKDRAIKQPRLSELLSSRRLIFVRQPTIHCLCCLAYYGRGFMLSDKSCTHLDCPFSGLSTPGPCTNFEGVMSSREIARLVKDKNILRILMEGAQAKQITWDDQWIGYDDEDTFVAKIKTANSLCMGGTMIWSINLDSRSGCGNLHDENLATTTVHLPRA